MLLVFLLSGVEGLGRFTAEGAPRTGYDAARRLVHSPDIRPELTYDRFNTNVLKRKHRHKLKPEMYTTTAE